MILSIVILMTTASNSILTNSINAIVPSTGVISIGSSQTSGILNLGTGGLRTATGVINIGTGGTSSPCIVNIANGGVTQAGAVNIANTGGATISTAVNIGNGSSTGIVTIGNPANNVLLNGATITIANNSVGGTVQIKNANNSVGEVQIVTSGAGTNTTPVKISTGTTTGAVTIGSSSNVTNLNSTTVNVSRNTTNTTNTFVEVVSGSSSNNVRFHSSGTNNVTSDARITVSGGSASVDTGTMAIVAGEVQMYATFALQAGKNITLQPTASYVTPTAGQLGFSAVILTPVGGGNSTTANTDTVLRSASLTAGVWMLIGNSNMGTSGTFALISISATSVIDNDSIVSTPNSGLYLNISRLVTLTATTTYSLIGKTQLASTLNNVTFTAVRIA